MQGIRICTNSCVSLFLFSRVRSSSKTNELCHKVYGWYRSNVIAYPTPIFLVDFTAPKDLNLLFEQLFDNNLTTGILNLIFFVFIYFVCYYRGICFIDNGTSRRRTRNARFRARRADHLTTSMYKFNCSFDRRKTRTENKNRKINRS